MRERSTVGSASATGSVGGRTTWASGSDVYDANTDKMSEDTTDQDVETSSMGGFSDEGQASLVGFGEGARTPARQQSSFGSPVAAKATPVPSGLRESTTPSAREQQDARMIDGEDTNMRTPTSEVGPGEVNHERSTETSERLMRERMGHDGNN